MSRTLPRAMQLQSVQIRFEQCVGRGGHLVALQPKAEIMSLASPLGNLGPRASCRSCHTTSGSAMQWFGKAVGGIIGFVAGGPGRSRVLGLASRSSARRPRRVSARRDRSLQQNQPTVLRGGVRGDGAGREDRRPRLRGRDARRARDHARHASLARASRERDRAFTRGKERRAIRSTRTRSAGSNGRSAIAASSRAHSCSIQLQAAIGAGPIGPRSDSCCGTSQARCT